MLNGIVAHDGGHGKPSAITGLQIQLPENSGRYFVIDCQLEGVSWVGRH